MKVYLEAHEMPSHFYNIVADLTNRPLPPLHPQTKQPVGPADLTPLFPMELILQEVSTDRNIPIPDPVREIYALYRPSPLVRATRLEQALGTRSKIFYKYEGGSPSGSHKANTAIAQAYYNKQEGIKKIVTETGAGQWGTALSFACAQFGLECEVFMVKGSYDQKPYRRSIMQTFGATVHASPSNLTQAGIDVLKEEPNSLGSLGIAISEAVEIAVQDPSTHYSLGSVLNHVLLHQTVIGQEAQKQFEKIKEYPDVIIAPLGGGSNFAGISFPFIGEMLRGGKKVRAIAVEPASCPKLTRGVFGYDYGDKSGYTPLLPMYSLGHDFIPPGIHAGGLRYHGASALCSQLLKDGLIEASAIQQIECFEAGLLFAKAEGIIPAPEANHALAQVLREVKQADEEGKEKTILFNLCGHGHFDMSAYTDFIQGKLVNHELEQELLDKYATSVDTMLAQ